MKKMTANKSLGYTLIELMIVVAIIGVLAAFAYPSYKGQTNKGKEAEAKAALTALAGAMTQFYLNAGTYAGAALGAPGSSGGIFSNQVPLAAGSKKTYDLSITTQTQTAFTLKATPVSPNSAKLKGFTLNEMGVFTEF